ncbi:MAG: hypothetical protein EP330_22475 [Deltaproteobacteria bacterium]|nr:MAG: hypothetical protein EP330_22475 [Deltaproteobacteria bacterium]
MTRALLPVLLLTAGACRKVEPAPEDLDGLVHFVWQQLDEGEDAALTDAINNLHIAIDGDTIGFPNGDGDILEGVVTDLTPEEVASFGRDVDPSTATGVLLADRITCTMPRLEEVISYENQDELYTGVYDAYTRTMLSSREDFLANTNDRLGWDLTYETSVLGSGYTVNSQTLMRRITEVETPDGPATILRAHMRDSAVFENPDTNNFLEQDYHLEIYWPFEGDVLHVYALWKDTQMLGFEDEGEQTQRITLNNLIDWDEGTGTICQDASLP